MAKGKPRTEYQRESDRVRKILKRFIDKSGLNKEAYNKMRDAIHAGSVEDFFERASKLHSVQDIQSAWAHIAEDLGIVKFDKITDPDKNEDAFQTALSIIGSKPSPQSDVAGYLGHDFSQEPYHSPKTEAQNIIDSWWNGIIRNQIKSHTFYSRHNPLPTHVLDSLRQWKDATIALIGEDAFADLIQNEMSYNVDSCYGTVDWVEFFETLYDDETKEYESDEEVASRIRFWLDIATSKALEYLAVDDDMGDYDEVASHILESLDDITSW